jgi:uncharacterized protein
MRWDSKHTSPDVIDRRGRGGGASGAGLFWIIAMLLRSRFGWVGVLIAVVGFMAYGAFNFFRAEGDSAAQLDESAAGVNDEMKAFVGFVLDDVQDTMQQKLVGYERAKLVLFTGSTQTSCGYGEAATGPFYCPADRRVYIDLSFYQALSDRLGAPGDFAQAYVIAHEVGHHIQTLLGTSKDVHRLSAGERRGAEGPGVRLELQADCYAGVWAHATKKRDLLEAGDIEEALGAAAAIGDDRLQKRSRGVVQPETFTHGTSQQRQRWFRRGFDSGRLEACDTFEAASL